MGIRNYENKLFKDYEELLLKFENQEKLLKETNKLVKNLNKTIESLNKTIDELKKLMKNKPKKY